MSHRPIDREKVVIVRSSSVRWLVALFDPPPLASMTLAQKAGRVFLLVSTLVLGSILSAMLGALGLFIIDQGWTIGSTPEFLKGFGIVAIGVAVNVGCLIVLLQIKKADHKLIPPRD